MLTHRPKAEGAVLRRRTLVTPGSAVLSASTSSRGCIAVMQSYSYPHAEYFRLLAAAETFVVFDDAGS
jgi:hypothetical protein